MKRITQHYGADLEWVDSFSKNFNGEVIGNFIKIPDEIHKGDKYFLNCGEGMVALYVDVEYHINFRLIQKNLTDDFVGIYYNLSEGDVRMTYEEKSNNIGPWFYNLFIIDSTLEYQYDVKSGSRCFVLAIFIKKEVIKNYFVKNNVFKNKIADLFNPAGNTLIRWDRMSNESFHLLSELRKIEVGGSMFDLNLIATVHLLLSEYLVKVSSNDDIIIKSVNEADLSGIIDAQHFLIESVEKVYPGNKIIAQKVGMSESKFKILFKKITGIAPNTFFIENKLARAKTLLETKEFSVTDVATKFCFVSNSYFASQFKNKFGINPKQFIQQL
jgi:AraC-like DNA-binding protein